MGAAALMIPRLSKQELGGGVGRGVERAGIDGHGTGMLRARCKADGSVPKTSMIPTVCQVLVGVDGRGPRLLGRDP